MREITELLEKLAEKLGTTVENLWPVLIKQAPISGAVDLMLLVALVVTSVITYRIAQKCDDADEDVAVFAWILTGIIFFITAAFVLFGLKGIITALFHPEYWALSEILRQLK